MRAYAANLFPRPPPVDDEEEVDPSIPEHNRDIKVASGSLFIMSDEAELRHKLNKFLNGKPVDTFLLFCILTNVFILAIETPTATFRPAFVDLFHTVDFTLSVVFSSKRAQYNHCRCRSTPLQLLQPPPLPPAPAPAPPAPPAPAPPPPRLPSPRRSGSEVGSRRAAWSPVLPALSHWPVVPLSRTRAPQRRAE